MRYLLPALYALALAAFGQQYDTVISRGRVMDPETRLDAIRDVGIRDGQIIAISETPLEGRNVVDARGLVVSPGFIDLHQHGQTPENYAFKARDGVTTALEMEVGASPVDPWYQAREGKSLINFGATVGHIPARMTVLHDSGTFLPRDRAVDAAATPEQLEAILDLLRQGLDQGALGIGMGIAYVPGASRDEIFRVFQLAAARRTPVYVHLRSSGPVEPGGIDALQEVISDAAAAGASLHVVHITSTELRQTPVALNMLHSAARHNLDFTTEAYPYTAGMTDISSAIFSEGWQARNGGITYHDLQWAATGERLTAESFARNRKQGGMVAIHSIPEEMVRLAMADPDVIIASDGILDHGKGHPRAAGTYARVLGKYVRQEHVLSLVDALRKMSFLPAQRLNLSTKGRLQVGADADIVLFDPQRVNDPATFENPAQYSEGIPYVMVHGVWVVKDSQIQKDVFPGRPIRRGQ
ncbi:MAG TPA: amidohydrolase family protein [Bryobacteraceae bacterium]|jgi:N-acyl-D-aspartate/D-glutamate deacylase|nr:amidohydrolase family protein [Bryobacteraceae bacterium]